MEKVGQQIVEPTLKSLRRRRCYQQSLHLTGPRKGLQVQGQDDETICLYPFQDRPNR